MLIKPAKNLFAKANRKGFHLHPAPARDDEMPEFMDEYDDGNDADEGDGVGQEGDELFYHPSYIVERAGMKSKDAD